MNAIAENETKTLNIETLLPWSEPKEINTKVGRKNLRKAEPNEAFWKLWNDPGAKQAMKSAGVSLGKAWKDDTKREVCWWLPISTEHAAKENDVIAASKAIDANVKIPAPKDIDYMPFQKAGIIWLNNYHNTLLCDEQGLGKTIQIIGLMNLNPEIKKVLIVCPATLKINWKREMEKWLVIPRTIAIQNSNEPWVGNAADVVIMNFEIAKKFEANITAVQWDLFATDEAHGLKNPQSQRCQILLGCKAWKDRAAHAGITAKRKIFASGTPLVNRPIELWPLLHAVAPVEFSNKMKYAMRYCAARQTRWGWDMSGASNLDELQNRLRSHGLMIRRLKSAVLTELPPKIRQVIEVPANGSSDLIAKENEIYNSHEDLMAELHARLEVAELAGDQAAYEAACDKLKKAQAVLFQEMSKIRHEVAVAKIPVAISHIKDILAETEKLVVICHHRDVAEAIWSEFKKEFGAVLLYGGMSGEDKDAAVQAFQKDPNCRLFVGNILAAGVGITLTAASMMLLVELDWRPGIVSQVEDRIHRIGQTASVLIQHLILEKSLDARMVRVIIAKQQVMDKVLDKGDIASVGEEIATTIDYTNTVSNQAATKPEAAKEEKFFIASDELRALVHHGLQMLAGVCNYAQSWDGQGFNKFDAAFGHALAESSYLSDKMVAAGIKLCTKYKKQLGEDFADNLKAMIQ